MPRLSRKLRVCKWAGTLGCLLIAGLFAMSGWYNATYSWTPPEDYEEHQMALRSGNVYFLNYQLGQWFCPRPSGWHLWSKVSEERPRFFMIFPRLWTPRQISPGRWAVFLPLWLPFLLLLLPTLWLWRRDRRKPRLGFCRGCDYDLTGNTSCVCPECGAACEPARDVSLPSSR